MARQNLPFLLIILLIFVSVASTVLLWLPMRCVYQHEKGMVGENSRYRSPLRNRVITGRMVDNPDRSRRIVTFSMVSVLAAPPTVTSCPPF